MSNSQSFQDTAQARDRAVLVGVALGSARREDTEDELDELKELVRASTAEVAGTVIQRRQKPDPAFFVGKGKISEIKKVYEENSANVIVFNDDLSPGQARNVEKETGATVVTRSEVILDIFASRAKTHQAKLQVELAMAEYQLPRLKRLWTHLGRIRGGVNIKGMGEKQIEVDRRLIRKRITTLKEELEKIDDREKANVAARKGMFQVSLAGYTNVGKSTLMNALTGAKVKVADMLFATLDTRTRQMDVDHVRKALLSDTVGFIRKLPHNLVASFHATLEEAINADLVLHVVDASHRTARKNVAAAEDVLKEIGINAPVLTVLNKIDKAADNPEFHILRRQYSENVAVSAVTGEGLNALKQKIAEHMRSAEIPIKVDASPANGRLTSFLHGFADIEKQSTAENGRVAYTCRIAQSMLGELKRIKGDAKIQLR